MIRHILPRTLRVRLAILFALSTSIILATSGVLLHETLKRSVARTSELAMTASLTETLSQLRESRSLQEVKARSLASYSSFNSDDNLDVAIFDEYRTPLIWSDGYRTSFAALAVKGGAAPTLVEDPGHARRYLVTVVQHADGNTGPLRVAVQYDLRSEQAFLHVCAFSILVAVLLGTAVAATVAYQIAVFALKPLSQLAARADEISSGQLALPLLETGMTSELGELSQAFNRMLSRLNDSFTRLTQFSSDLAHDIRTPLTNLLAQAQVALSQPRSNAEYRAVIESSVEEFQRLSRMVDDMLFLARSGKKQEADLRPLEGSVEAERVAGYYETMADDAGVSIRVEGNTRFKGDPLLVQRALSNLLSNALAHAPAGSEIELRCEDHGDFSQISVTDVGKGIDEAHVHRIFDRFYRVDPARQNSASGTGLGLAIVKSIMEEHGGECNVTSVPYLQTTFLLRFPNGLRDDDAACFTAS
jgi:two-component system heavy metal sensor histidine kinase CusS